MLSGFEDDEKEEKVYLKQELSSYEYKIKRLLNYTLKSPQRDKILDVLVQKHLDEMYWFNRYYLNKEEIRELYAKGHSIGSHSHKHDLLADMSHQEQYQQISKSQEILSDILGHKVDTFCYPYGGVRSHNQETKKILKELGFSLAFAVNKSDQEDSYSISRRDCNEFMKVGS